MMNANTSLNKQVDTSIFDCFDVADVAATMYGELPGLILELREGDLLFLAKEIKLSSTERVEFKKPLKGKKVTLEEHNEIIKGFVSKHRRNKKY